MVFSINSYHELSHPHFRCLLYTSKDITQESIRKRNLAGLAHIPEDRHKYGLVLDYTLAQNLVLKSYFKQGFQRLGFINFKKVEDYAQHLIKQYDVRSGQGTRCV